MNAQTTPARQVRGDRHRAPRQVQGERDRAPRQVRGDRHRPRAWLVALVWIGVPAVWLLVTGLVGTQLNPDLAVYATPVLFGLLLVGLPLTVLFLTRALLGFPRGQEPDASVRLRRPQLRQMRAPEVLPAASVPRAPLGPGRRAAAAVVLVLMFATSLALWTVVPVGWVWIGSQVASSTRPEMEPYLLIIVGIPVTIFLGVRGLYRLDALYGRLTPRPPARRGRPAWLKSLSAERQRRPTTTADTVMLVSVIVALLFVLVWFVAFAELHSYGEWYMD